MQIIAKLVKGQKERNRHVKKNKTRKVLHFCRRNKLKILWYISLFLNFSFHGIFFNVSLIYHFHFHFYFHFYFFHYSTGRGKVTVEVFMKMANLSGLFSRSLRLSTLPLLEQHSPMPPPSQLGRFLI